MPSREHIDQEYEQELRHLREQFLLMGSHVEGIIGSSIRALIERDSDLANRVIAADRTVDVMEMDIDGMCLNVLARRQPVASDLRLVAMVLKAVTDLERMGDLGVNIAERVVELNNEPPLKPDVDLSKMADATQRMLREALDAFVAQDADRARRVIEHDQVIDDFYGQVFRELFTYMMEDAKNVYRATRFQSIAKYLERIGDHATNLAEVVVFMVEGWDIRHPDNRDVEGQN